MQWNCRILFFIVVLHIVSQNIYVKIQRIHHYDTVLTYFLIICKKNSSLVFDEGYIFDEKSTFYVNKKQLF